MSETLLLPGSGGVRLSVRLAGPAEAPLLILLHGFPESGGAWSRLIDPLVGDGFRVAAPDMRGYGASDAPIGIAAYHLEHLAADILALADALAANRFALAGHDWGGVVAWAVAGQAPERVSRLVILAAPHPDVFGEALRSDPRQMLRSLYVGAFQLAWLPERLLAARDYRALKRAMQRTSRPGTFSRADLDAFAEAWRGRLTPMLDYYRALRLPRRPLPPIATPTLITWGGRDAFLGRSLAEASRARGADAELIVREELSHWLHHEEPAWVTAQIARFCGA